MEAEDQTAPKELEGENAHYFGLYSHVLQVLNINDERVGGNIIVFHLGGLELLIGRKSTSPVGILLGSLFMYGIKVQWT